MLHLSENSTWWSNLVGELVREYPMYYPSWHKIKEKKKAGVLGRLMGSRSLAVLQDQQMEISETRGDALAEGSRRQYINGCALHRGLDNGHGSKGQIAGAHSRVIKNGNKVLKRTVGETKQEYKPTTAEEKQDRRNEMKAIGTLLMALLNKDQLKFHSYKDAKLLMKAIEKSTNSNSNTNEANNTAYEVSVAHTQSNPTSRDNLSDAMICAFLASQPNSPQLTQEDLEQIDPDELEEMNLEWEMAMLTIRARRFIKRTCRKLNVNGQRVRFDRTKVECYNCHKYGHFARECKALRNQENKGREINRRTMTIETPTENALVAQDGIGGLSSDNKKSQFNLVSYKAGLESIEARLAHYKKNEAVFEESINVLKLEVKLRDIALVENKRKLEKAEKERDKLKLTLEKLQNSSKIICWKENNKSKSNKGYHAVPPPFIGNFMPRKPDLTFMDEIVESENLDVTTVVTPSNVKAVESNHESANVKSNGDAVEPKTVRKNNFRPPVIEDWNSDDESEVEIIPKDKTVSSSTEKIKLVKSARETVEKYEDYDGGFVSFGDRKGRISGKECLVLSSDFKLLDESQVLLRVPRKDNIYSVDLKSVVPTKGLTCLFAKATIDESNLWHRRLGHINFKNMNKLVRENLVKEDDTAKANFVKEKIVNDEWWHKVSYILSFTEPIYDMIRTSDIDKPCLHLVYEMWDSMIEKVKFEIYKKEKRPTSQRSLFYDIVKDILVARWTKNNTPLHCLAHSLNPRYYSDAWLLEDSTRSALHRDAEISQERINCFRRLFPSADEHNMVLNEYAMFSMKSGTLAFRLLGQPTSSSCAERNWSTYAFIHSLRRNKLTTSRAQDLVFIHNNLRLLSRNPNDDEKMWDVGGDAFDSMEDVGFLEFADLSLDEPEFENDFIIDN
ncbi:hAT dimerization domain, ribonuclease H-like domain protein [Tanacetum coccineum]